LLVFVTGDTQAVLRRKWRLFTNSWFLLKDTTIHGRLHEILRSAF